MQESDESTGVGSFESLGLSEPLRRGLIDLGYEVPTPIQLQTIPLLLEGRDVVGQAQTGTGKTAAFALPILQRIDVNLNEVQALVLTPTRELALQVAEAFHSYARHVGRVRVLPVYGGQAIQPQLNRLRSGMQIIVGTPGRIMDHLRRGSLELGALSTVVLDEADEMLRMGFIDDVEWILAQAPASVQKALFSATIPAEIHQIAERYLHEPESVQTVQRTLTVPSVEQHFLVVAEPAKLEALMQLLELEATPGEAALIFARTKTAAAELAERLNERGYAAEALHGDLNQAQRENVIRRLRSGQLELVTATDVAARGLDVERIGLVVNYHVPNDPEWYLHRIGRTARAGRAGRAVIFVTPREQRLLRDIERFIGQQIKPMKAPTRADIAARRVALFKEQILSYINGEDLDLYLSLVQEIVEESGRDMATVAAAAARLARGDKPLAPAIDEIPADLIPAEEGMVRLIIDVGRRQGVRPTDIVGAIANEAGIPGRSIGAIDIYDRFTFVEIPAEQREQVLTAMAGKTIRHQPVTVRLAQAQDAPQRAEHRAGGADDREFLDRRGGQAPARLGDRRGAFAPPVRSDPHPSNKVGHGPTSRPAGLRRPRPLGKAERPPRRK